MMFEVEMVPVLAAKENISFLFFFFFFYFGVWEDYRTYFCDEFLDQVHEEFIE